MASKIREILRVVTAFLAALFLVSAVLNFRFTIPLGFTHLTFSSPSQTIAEFEIVIGVFLLVAAIVSNLYVYGGAYLLATVGIVEGLLASDVQGLARSIHELMIPFAIAGGIILIGEVGRSMRSRKFESTSKRNRELVTALQFFVGGLVTLGGAEYARGGTYPVGTALGLIHLAVGITGLLGGYFFLKRKSWSSRFLLAINGITIAYSALSESLAEIYAFLPRGINDALIGTIIAIVVSAVIISLLTITRPSPPVQKVSPAGNSSSVIPN